MKMSFDFPERVSSNVNADSFGEALQTARIKFLNEAARIVEQEALMHHHYTSRSGKLDASVMSRVLPDEDSIEVYLDSRIAAYGAYIHEGTGVYGENGRPYEIDPVTAPVLFFEDRFAKRVMVLGIRPDPFLHDALEAVRDDIYRMADDIFEGLEEML